MKKKTATVAALATVALVVGTATPAAAAGPTWTNGYVNVNSTCSTFLSSDCSIWLQIPGYSSLKNVRPHEDSPVWNCQTIGIPHGTRLGNSGVIGKLEANRHKIDGYWVGAKVTVQTGDEDYIRCNY